MRITHAEKTETTSPNIHILVLDTTTHNWKGQTTQAKRHSCRVERQTSKSQVTKQMSINEVKVSGTSVNKEG